MSAMDRRPVESGTRPARMHPEVEASLARARFLLARSREHRLREERLEAEARRLREERRPRGFFIGFI